MPSVPEADPDLVERALRIVGWFRRFQRIEVVGEENLPEGPCLITPNHTGWAGLDHAFLAHVLKEDLQRRFVTAVHPSYFEVRKGRELAERLGMFEAKVSTAVEALDDGQTVVLFPEGEDGNFKPFWRLYQLQTFQPGFARIALAALRPVVPVTIIGGEEASPVLGQVKLGGKVPIPIPLSVLPLPVRWRITFHEPIDPTAWLKRDDLKDGDMIEAFRSHVEGVMRTKVAEDLEARGHPFWGRSGDGDA